MLIVLNPIPSFAEDCTGTLPGGDCTLDEDTTADLTIDNGVTLSIGTSVTLGNDIDGSTLSGDGTISTFGGGTTINQTGDIGSTTPIEELLINDDNTWTTSGSINTDNDGSDINLGAVDGGETLNFLSGSSYSGEIDGNAADTVNFGSDGNGGTFITGGQIESVTLVITSGDLTINNTVGGGAALNSLSVADGASMTMNESVSTAGALDNDGTIVIGAGTTLSADTYTADADAGTFVIKVDRNTGTTETGILDVASGGPLDLSNDTLQISLDSVSSVLINETISDFIVGNTAATVAPNTFVDESYLYNFQLLASGDNYDLVITVNSLGNLTTTQNNLEVANVLLRKLGNVDNDSFNRLQSILGSASTSEEFNETLESFQPTVDGGYVAASMGVNDKLKQTTHERIKTLFRGSRILSSGSSKVSSLSDITPDAGGKALVSGSKDLISGKRLKDKKSDTKLHTSSRKGSLWAQPFITSATQGKKDGIDGFESSSRGIVVGADSAGMHDDMIFGVAFTAAETDIDSQNANSTETDVSSFGVNLYGGVLVLPETILDASASYIHNNNEYLRKSVAGVRGNNASAEYIAQHISLNSRLSHQYRPVGDLTITPSARLSYDYIYSDPYDEHGTGASSLQIDQAAIDNVSTGLGVDLDWQHEMDNGGIVRPKAYADYTYDVSGEGISVLSNFAGSTSNTFATQGFEAPKNIFNLGAGFDYEMTQSMKFTAGYDYEYKDEYDSHTGYVNFVKNFY